MLYYCKLVNVTICNSAKNNFVLSSFNLILAFCFFRFYQKSRIYVTVVSKILLHMQYLKPHAHQCAYYHQDINLWCFVFPLALLSTLLQQCRLMLTVSFTQYRVSLSIWRNCINHTIVTFYTLLMHFTHYPCININKLEWRDMLLHQGRETKNSNSRQ